MKNIFIQKNLCTCYFLDGDKKIRSCAAKVNTMKHGINMNGYVSSEIDNSWEVLLKNNETEFIAKPKYITETQGQHHYKYLNYNETSTNQCIITNGSPIRILISINSEKF